MYKSLGLIHVRGIMNNKTIALNEALKRVVSETHQKPVINQYELISYIYMLYRDKSFDGVKIGKISLDEPDARVIQRNIDDLIDKKIISQHIGLPIYFVNGRPIPTAQQYICSIYQFSYLSYLSAMEWHGITDRIPYTVHVTACLNSRYKTLLNEIIFKEFNNVSNLNAFYMPRVSAPPSFDGKKFKIHQSSSFVMPREVSGSGGVRVSTIGDTFLDMLKKPDLCGGINHVIDVYEEFAADHLPVILRAFDKRGNSMDRARCGYILENVCCLSHRTIDKWKSDVQRGGSRKLVPENEYSSEYSEAWCLSINL